MTLEDLLAEWRLKRDSLDQQLQALRSGQRQDEVGGNAAATIAQLEAQRARFDALIAEQGRCFDALS
jgi:hypothetical protein